MTLRARDLEQALRQTGERLDSRGRQGTVRLYLAGGSAGTLGGLLTASRSTGDVDVTTVVPEGAWEAVREAAREVAKVLDLPETWLNDSCQIYAWRLPLGWRERCKPGGTYGPLEIWLLDRRDFIAGKVLSAPGRPQDLEDLRDIRPTSEELAFAEENVDRVIRESPDPDESFEDARVILQALRGES